MAAVTTYPAPRQATRSNAISQRNVYLASANRSFGMQYYSLLEATHYGEYSDFLECTCSIRKKNLLHPQLMSQYRD